MPSRSSAAYLALALPLVVGAYRWPSHQYEALESMLYGGSTLSGNSVSFIAANCAHRNAFDPPTTSGLVAAEWLRFAYHDMATHDAVAGTGGIDASIFYELDRPENVGQAMFFSTIDLGGKFSKYVSTADVIAMGAVWSVVACNGPVIPFRGGRIDATEAGRPGVPEPQQDLATHTASFRTQGFKPQEMIQLVACGHTLGGVRSPDFPDIVPPLTPVDADDDGFVLDTFDTTDAYDNKVVTEYLQGTTQNPLIVTPNATFHSDLRIFSSDGNSTMKSLRNPTTFRNTCKVMLERMINTVPAGVTLTEEITLLPFKVNDARVTLNNSVLVFTSTVRVTIPKLPGGETPTSSPKTVTLFWCDKQMPASRCSRSTAHTQSALGPAAISFGGSPLMDNINSTFATYMFQAAVGNASVSKFWFEVQDSRSRMTVVEDNGGAGYIIDQDDVIYVPSLSEVRFANGQAAVYIVAGVRGSASSVTQASISVHDTVSTTFDGPPFSLPQISSVPLILDSKLRSADGYIFYSANISVSFEATVDFHFTFKGKSYTIDFIHPTDAIALSFDN